MTLLAAHLHAHNLAKKFKLSVESPSGHRNVVKYIDNYGGYGKDQDFSCWQTGESASRG